MSIFSLLLYLIVIAIVIKGATYYFRRSKKAAYITLAISPIYLIVAHFISPYINWRGKFGGIVHFAHFQLGLSTQNAIIAGYVFHFIFFWVIFFVLSALTFKFVIKQNQETKNE